jgi:uncharacterized protein YciI
MVLGLLAAPVMAADTAEATSLYLVLYKQGPAWKEGVPMQQQDAIVPHYRYMKQMYEKGVILDAGPTLDEPGGVVILRAESLEAAEAIVAADPSVTMKMFVGEVHAWSPVFHSPDPLPNPAAPDRSVKGNTLTSGHDPAAQVALPDSASYVGADRWTMKAYADDVELHAFVDADPAKDVERLYWVQFEAYLPTHPEYHHTYDSTRHVTLGDLDCHVDTWVESTDAKDDPDSDSAHLHGLLRTKGYALPASMMSVRFVHLMDGARKELMFIYSEPTPDGLRAEDLKKGGKAYDRWPALEKGLIERGQQSIRIH